MEKLYFFNSFSFLAALLGVLLYIYFAIQKKKKQKLRTLALQEKNKPDEQLTFEALVHIVQKKSTSKEVFESSLEKILEHYGKIDSKLNSYIDVLIIVCNHPQTTKEIIINFEKNLIARNPEFKNEISAAVMQGLNARRKKS